jgi:Tol biopolymer transport system component
MPAAWLPGDRQLIYYAIGQQGNATLWMQETTAASEARSVIGALPSLGGVDLSPDGRWIAYHTQESGQQQVYVESFPGPGPRTQISTDGGGSPVWRADGQELFYARPSREGQPRNAGEFDVAIMGVAVTSSATSSPRCSASRTGPRS